MTRSDQRDATQPPRRADGGDGSSAGAPMQLTRLANGDLVGSFPALAAEPGIVHRVTTRAGPAFAGPAASPQLAATAAALATTLALESAAWADQVHGGTVREAEAAGLVGPADGIWTLRPGLGLLGRSADCPLVLVAAPSTRGASAQRSVVGMAHASWRATAAGITAKLAGTLLQQGGAAAADLIAVICPSAGPCCYEVGDEVRDAYRGSLGRHSAAFFVRRRSGLYLDLWAANRDQLRRAGVRSASIHTAGICTICRHDLFPSYRAEGRTAGRFAAIIGCRR